MAVHNGCNGSGRQVIEVTLGADRAWWSDWSSKPAGVRMDLGRFDSYTLPPRPAGCVALQRHGCSEPASVDRAICTIIGSDPWHYPCTKAGRLPGREPCPQPPS